MEKLASLTHTEVRADAFLTVAHWYQPRETFRGISAVVISEDTHSVHDVQLTISDRHWHAHCECDWSRFDGAGCSHVIKAISVYARLQGRRAKFYTDEDAARRQKQMTRRVAAGLWVTLRKAD